MSLKALLFRKITPPIPPKIKKLFITIIILIALFWVYALAGHFIGRLYFSYLDKFIPESVVYSVTAALVGIIYFLIDGIIRKRSKKSIIPSIQVFLVFSTIPFVLSFAGSFSGWDWGVYVYQNIINKYLFYLICILPELIAFLGCILLRRKAHVTGGIFAATAIIVAIEILPLRAVFFYDADNKLYFYVSDPENIRPFGKEDRELEFKRSFKIIENLATYSKKEIVKNLTEVVVYQPDLEKYPDLLKLDTLCCIGSQAYWEKMEDGFIKKEYLLDVKLDSDGDGLSDFQEAEMLCDAYNIDSDSDDIIDKQDTDPLNKFIKSDFADIKTAILKELEVYPDSCIFHLIDNEFYNGHGEFENCDKYVILLHPDQISKWNIIFGEQYMMGSQRSLSGQRLNFRKYIMDLTGRLVIMLVVQMHGVWADSSGLVFLLIKLGGKWHLIAGRCIWI